MIAFEQAVALCGWLGIMWAAWCLVRMAALAQAEAD